MTTPLLKFFPLMKVDEATHTVGGIATSETPDHSGEIADYAASKKAYAAWSGDFKKRTAAAGQESSLGNIRKQHSLEVAGKTTAIHYDDDAKAISIDTVPIDDAMWEQIQKGFFTGFSHGGEYAFRQCNECETTIPEGNLCPSCKKQVLVRYGPILSEVSYVDNGCNPDACFTYVKADGTTEMRKFHSRLGEGANTMEKIDTTELAKQVAAEMRKGETKTKRVAGEDLKSSAFLIVGDKDDTSTWKLPVKFSDDKKTKSHIRNALARFDQLKDVSAEDKAAAKKKLDALAEKHGIDVADAAEKVEKARVDLYNGIHKAMAGNLAKGMYTVSSLASMVETLAWMQRGVFGEEAYENDLESQIPEKLRENVEGLIETFLLMAEEETAELAAAMQKSKPKENTMEKKEITNAAELSELKKQADDLNAKIAVLMKGEKKKKAEDLSIEDDDEDGDGEPKKIDPINNPELNGKSAITVDMLKEALKQAREEGVSEFVKALTKAMEDDDDDEDHVEGCKCEDCKAEKAKKAKKKEKKDEDDEKEEEKKRAEKANDAKGIGSRTAATSGGPFFGSQPVTKMQDRGGEVATVTALTPEVMEKAMAGDREAIATLGKSAPAAAAVPSTLQGLFIPR